MTIEELVRRVFKARHEISTSHIGVDFGAWRVLLHPRDLRALRAEWKRREAWGANHPAFHPEGSGYAEFDSVCGIRVEPDARVKIGDVRLVCEVVA